MLFKIFFALKEPITTAADDIYIIFADDSSCLFDVCVCVCVCVAGGGGGGKGLNI